MTMAAAAPIALVGPRTASIAYHHARLAEFARAEALLVDPNDPLEQSQQLIERAHQVRILTLTGELDWPTAQVVAYAEAAGKPLRWRQPPRWACPCCGSVAVGVLDGSPIGCAACGWDAVQPPSPTRRAANDSLLFDSPVALRREVEQLTAMLGEAGRLRIYLAGLLELDQSQQRLDGQLVEAVSATLAAAAAIAERPRWSRLNPAATRWLVAAVQQVYLALTHGAPEAAHWWCRTVLVSVGSLPTAATARGPLQVDPAALDGRDLPRAAGTLAALGATAGWAWRPVRLCPFDVQDLDQLLHDPVWRRLASPQAQSRLAHGLGRLVGEAAGRADAVTLTWVEAAQLVEVLEELDGDHGTVTGDAAAAWLARQLRGRICPTGPAFDRERLGAVVRAAWVAWASQQPHPKPSWLVDWDQLGEADREADRLIGEAVAAAVLGLPTSASTWAATHGAADQVPLARPA
jgi:hypothetical protein